MRKPRWIKTKDGYVNVHHNFSGELKVLLGFIKEQMAESAKGLDKQIEYAKEIQELHKIINH